MKPEDLIPPDRWKGASFPWYAVTKKALCGRILLAGPFLTHEEAEHHLRENVKIYGGTAVIWCYSGRFSPAFRAIYQLLLEGKIALDDTITK